MYTVRRQVKTLISIVSVGISYKDTRLGAFIKFMIRIRTQPRKT